MAEPIPLPPSTAVTLTALLIPLFRLCGLVVSMGIVFAVDALCRAFFGTAEGAVGWIPFVGRVIASPIHRIEQKVSSLLGGLEAHIDASMGGYFHALADAVGRLADGEAESAWLDWTLAKAIRLVRYGVHALPSTGSVTKITNTVVKQTRTVVRTVIRVEKIASDAAPATLVGTVGTIAGELDHVIEWDIPRLKKQTRSIENELGRLWKVARSHTLLAGTAAFAAAVAVALSRLGLDWIRCNTAKSVFKKRGCGLWSDIDRLLAAVAEVALVTNICQVIPWIEKGFSVVAAPLISTLTDVGAGLCKKDSAPPELLPVTTLHLTGSPDATLHLP